MCCGSVVFDGSSSLFSRAQAFVVTATCSILYAESPSAGFELARTMQHDNEKVKAIPILMLTAVNQKFPLGFGTHDIDESWMPVADFLEKPVDFDVLPNKVLKLLPEASWSTNRNEQEP